MQVSTFIFFTGKQLRVYPSKTVRMPWAIAGRLDARSTSYTMCCPPVREDNPRALASGLSYVQADNPWYNHFIPPISV